MLSGLTIEEDEVDGHEEELRDEEEDQEDHGEGGTGGVTALEILAGEVLV